MPSGVPARRNGDGRRLGSTSWKRMPPDVASVFYGFDPGAAARGYPDIFYGDDRSDALACRYHDAHPGKRHAAGQGIQADRWRHYHTSGVNRLDNVDAEDRCIDDRRDERLSWRLRRSVLVR